MRRMRLHNESDGQGVLEVVFVLGTFLLLVAVALPSYFGYMNSRAEQQAKDNLLAAVPAVETYRVQRGSYAGLNTVKLMRMDPRLSPTLVVASAKRRHYCLMDSAHGQVWTVSGRRGKQPAFSSDECPRA